VDPGFQIVSSSTVDQIETALKNVEAEVSQRVPLLFVDGKKGADEGKASKDLDKLVKAQQLWEAVARLDPEYQNIQAELRSLNEFVSSLSTEQMAAQASKKVQEARQSLQEVQDALKAEDFEKFKSARTSGIENCAYVLGLTGSGLDDAKQQATQIRLQMMEAQFPPEVTDWELIDIHERPMGGRTDFIVLLRPKGSLRTIQLKERDKDPASGLTVVEVDKEGKEFVVVRKPDHRKTKLIKIR